MKVSQLKLNPNNPRKIQPDKLEKLCASITNLPQMMTLRPIVYDPVTMHVLGGNQRLAAIRKLGMKEIPDTWAIAATDLTPEQQKEFVLRDNVQFGDWDFEMLSAEFAEFDLSEMGMDMPEIQIGDTTEVQEDDYEEPAQIATDIQYGDVYLLLKDGKEIHRLMCGDSTKKDDVDKLFIDDNSELLFTSPPYSDMRDYGGNVDLSVDNVSNFIPAWKERCEYQAVNLGIQRKDHNIVTYWDTYIEKAKSAGYKFLAWNVWVKASGAGSVGQQSAFFPIIHEWIFVFGNAFKDIYRTLDKKRPDKIKVSGQRQKDGTVKPSTIGVTLEKKELESVIICNAELGDIRSLHPATFNVELPAAYIKAITSRNDVVCDPFIGSGTTMVAAHQLGRKCYGMEINPTYCQIVIDRMKKLDSEIEIQKVS